MFKKRIKHKTRHNKRKKPLTRFIKPIFISLTASISIGFVVWYLSTFQPIGFLKVAITWDIDPQLPVVQTVLERQIQPLISQTYWLDLQNLKQTLQQQPWVAQVRIKRILWNAVKITLTAKKTAMRWENLDCKTQKTSSNCSGYIADDGTLFITDNLGSLTAGATAISIPDKPVAAQLYKDYQTYQTLAKTMIIKSFTQTHIQKLTFKPDIKVVLGAQKQPQRLMRFLKAYKKLRKKTHKAKNATFDMRYPKGFSVRY